jgi:protein O-mannosyl-transferase
MNIRKPFQLMLLWLVVLGVYYPAIFSGLNSVDDQRMLYSLESSAGEPWFERFFPTGGFYYRPLLMLTFRLDHLFWGQEVGFYHLENILIHGASATLVFFILRQLMVRESSAQAISEWPLLGSLLFALHPIVTESVNWISGRTDLLGSFFVLAVTLVLLASTRHVSQSLVVMAVFLLGCAILSKEVMVFFVPAAAFLLWRWSDNAPLFWRRRALLILILPFLAGGIGFVTLRWLRYGFGGDLDRLIHNYHYGAFDTVRVFFKVLGFYGKKMVAPLPLNFAIMQVSDLYVLLGILLFGVAFGLFLLRRPYSDLVFVSIFLILPGILIALFSVAWTPLAERYIYLSSAFFVMGLSFYCSMLPSVRIRGIVTSCVAVLLFPVSISTVQRNFIWQDNGKLYADSLKKSPQFAAMSNELAIALINDGQYGHASQILEDAKKLKTASPLLYINQARIFVDQGKLADARSEIMKICTEKTVANIEALKMLSRIDEKRLSMGVDRDAVLVDLIDTYRVLIEKTGNPHHEYRLGQLLLFAGKDQEAGQSFDRAYQGAPVGSFYREAAGKLALKLLNPRGV